MKFKKILVLIFLILNVTSLKADYLYQYNLCGTKTTSNNTVSISDMVGGKKLFSSSTSAIEYHKESQAIYINNSNKLTRAAKIFYPEKIIATLPATNGRLTSDADFIYFFYSNKYIAKYDLNGNYQQTLTLSVPDGDSRSAIDIYNGHIYIAKYSGHIEKYSIEGNYLESIKPSGTYYNYINGIEFMNNGTMLVDTDYDKIYIFNNGYVINYDKIINTPETFSFDISSYNNNIIVMGNDSYYLLNGTEPY